MNYRPSLQQKLNESDYSDYTLHFQSVSNSNGSVLFIDHSQDQKLTIGINVDDTEFKYRVKAQFPAIVADLIDLAVAIYTSDRLAPQSLTKKQRRFYVILPLRHPELFSAEPFRTKLDDLLKWTTDSEWVFDFQKRIAPELYQNYLSEWNEVESQIADGLLNKGNYQKASSRYVVSSQQG
jgi:hypothetical protein